MGKNSKYAGCLQNRLLLGGGMEKQEEIIQKVNSTGGWLQPMRVTTQKALGACQSQGVFDIVRSQSGAPAQVSKRHTVHEPHRAKHELKRLIFWLNNGDVYGSGIFHVAVWLAPPLGAGDTRCLR